MHDKRRQHSSSNLVEFPNNLEQRFQSALKDFADTKSRPQALEKFLGLIDDGCDEAYVFVGVYYERGCEGLERDFEKARFYYERAIETRGSAEAYLGLGRIYYFGLGVRQNFLKAFQYYDLVAKEAEHNGMAYLMLGQMYQHGQHVDKNLEKAKECYQKAWQQGYVLGLTYLGKLEQERGHYVKGWLYRLKAAFVAIPIILKDAHDSRLRSC